MAIILARHGERLDCAECFTIDAEGCYWDETTDQPWDPPLTASGELQAAGLGRDIMAHLSALQLPPLTHVFTSPFVRCFETAAEIAKVHRLASVCVEPALSEGFDEPFYRSWCVPGANCEYGGPPGCGVGVQVPHSQLHPAALRSAADLVPMDRLYALEEKQADIDMMYKPMLPLSRLNYTWGKFETEKQLESRMRSFFDFVADSFKNETILMVSHGGPTRLLFASVFPQAGFGMCGYCGLYIMCKSPSDNTWIAPVTPFTEVMSVQDLKLEPEHICAQCGIESHDGAPGDGEFEGHWFCKLCWQDFLLAKSERN